MLMGNIKLTPDSGVLQTLFQVPVAAILAPSLSRSRTREKG